VARFNSALFDLDGLLADTEGLHLIAYNAVADYLGISLEHDYICAFIGGPTRENIRKMMIDNAIPLERFDEVLELRYRSYMKAIQTTVVSPMVGAIDCLNDAKQRGLQTALVTSSIREHTLAVLNNISKHWNSRKDVAALFDVAVFGDEVEHLKPEPDIYLEALQRLQVPTESAVVLEDSEFGVLAAKRAGLYVIAVPGPHTKDQSFDAADLCVASLAEVVKRGLLQ
jgi:beta-phosphoglucomutase-like phosphatase (HAD superfamily)